MWEIELYADFEKGAKRLTKTNRQEMKNVLDNLAAYFAALQNGLSPHQIVRGFVHNEPHGIKALDESGPGKHKKAIRLYVFPDLETEILHVLTVGDKGMQREDIKCCAEFVKDLFKSRKSPPNQNQDY